MNTDVENVKQAKESFNRVLDNKTYAQITETEKSLYDMTNDNGVIWVKHCNVGNTIFVKQ